MRWSLGLKGSWHVWENVAPGQVNTKKITAVTANNVHFNVLFMKNPAPLHTYFLLCSEDKANYNNEV
jgi:hypothetical protein